MTKKTFIKLRTKEKKLREQLILDTVQKLIREKNLFAITLKDISQEIGIAPTSIYRFFRSKDDIFYHIVLNDIERIHVLIEKNSSSIVSVDGFVDAITDYLIKNDLVSKILWYFFIGMESNETVLTYFNIIEKKILGIFEKIFVQMGVNGSYKLRAEVLLYSLMGLIIFFRKTSELDEKQIKQYLAPVTESIMLDWPPFLEEGKGKFSGFRVKAETETA